MKNQDTLNALSLIAAGALALVGCDRGQQAAAPATQQATVEEHDHAEHSAGPHDGTLADWGGGKFHIEFTVDHDQQEATVYVLGEDERTVRSIAAKAIQLSIQDPPMQVVLAATPQEGDAAGTASRYVGEHEGLGVVQEYSGTISGVVDGVPYSADFEEEPHSDHDH